MTLPLGMILFGSLLVYAGWTGKSVGSLLAGGSIAPATATKPPAGTRGPIPSSGVIPRTSSTPRGDGSILGSYV